MKRKSSLIEISQQDSLFEVPGAGILMRNEKFISSHPSRSQPSLLEQQASQLGGWWHSSLEWGATSKWFTLAQEVLPTVQTLVGD